MRCPVLPSTDHECGKHGGLDRYEQNADEVLDECCSYFPFQHRVRRDNKPGSKKHRAIIRLG